MKIELTKKELQDIVAERASVFFTQVAVDKFSITVTPAGYDNDGGVIFELTPKAVE